MSDVINYFHREWSRNVFFGFDGKLQDFFRQAFIQFFQRRPLELIQFPQIPQNFYVSTGHIGANR